MTLIEIMIVLAIIALVMSLLVGPAIMNSFGSARVDACFAMTKQIESAWVRWKLAGQGDCPTSVDELNAELGRRAGEKVLDPWGLPYVLKCAEAAPPGCDDVCVLSMGKDGKEGTEDDVRSWVTRQGR